MLALNLHGLQQQLAAHLSRTAWAEQMQDLTILAHGEANVILRLNPTTLVRVAVSTPNQRFGGQAQQVTRFEHQILTYLRGSGIGHTLLDAQLQPTPDFPYTYLITSYLNGSPLDYSPTHLHQAAATLALLHRLPQLGYPVESLLPTVPLLEQPLSQFYREAQAYAQPYLDSPQADPEIVQMLQAVLARAAEGLKRESQLAAYPHRCLVHSDHTHENWVISPERAYLIDWEWAEVGSPAGDLGHFLSPLTVRRCQDHCLTAAERAAFLQHYYEALDDAALAERIQQHFAAFGVYPAVRSLCWTAGYWITANLWYAQADNPSSQERLARFQRSRQQFPELWQEIMDWFAELG
ncbi:MAG: phosphotransferase [Elainella sp.]